MFSPLLEHRDGGWLAYQCYCDRPHLYKQSSTTTGLDIVFDVIDTLASGSQTVIQMLCDMISSKVTGSTDKSKKTAAVSETYVKLAPLSYQHIADNLRSEWVLFSFLEHYLGRLEGPVAVQVWPRFMLLAKEISTISRDSRPQAYATLR
jgi:hypothetical protein